ncbi:S-layer homology domain-containing protein [Candidatus Gracilibacteria bacterium]|nr:S-layer homology domain-containing protein [Candidatus Gracilibacteria bacterium]MCF7856235.1 S-layer homology domain-containing protein [Candidatus Gracilibacteria bacterium]MCF7896700.1 S-layer homology domain-containing protein [Candidatus Gracilibacteria bacterium]
MRGLTKFRKVVFAALIFFCSTGIAQAVFSDVPVDHPNSVAIDFLSKEKVISGYPDGSFGPANPVNRAEALKILLLASGLPVNTSRSGNFPDVAEEAWFAPFVFSADARGIANGYPDGFFRPEQTVNLVEALKMLFAANSVVLENYETEAQLFADSEKRAWYNAFLFYAQTFQIVEPDSANKIYPATSLTRAQLAEIVFRFQTRVENTCPQFLENSKTIRSNYFRAIQLAEELPNIFYENEVFALRGTVDHFVEDISAIVENRSTKDQTHFTASVENQNFTIPVSFTTPGSYNFTAIPSDASSNSAATIEVVPRECQPATVAAVGTPPINLRTELVDNQPTVFWNPANNNLFRVVIRQGNQRFEKLVSVNQTSLKLNPADFQDFASGAATLQVFGTRVEKGWSFEPRSGWFASPVSTIQLSQHHFSEFNQTKISLANLPTLRVPNITLAGTALVDLESEAYLITPRGQVETIPILEDSEKISAGSEFSLSLQLPEVGTYILEINGTSGIAALNHPLYLPGQFPLLPDFADLREPREEDFKFSLSREKSLWMRAVNDTRAQLQLSKVNLDVELSAFAQKYAEEMAAKNFFGHVDLSGNDPDARRKIFGLALPVGENLARDYQTAYAHAGLLRSAAHLSNILTPEWTRVGLGIAEDSEGRMLFVQEFSTDPLSTENLAQTKSRLLAEINSLRSANGLVSLRADSDLENVAQAWSAKMLAEDFLDFAYGDDSLENSIRATGSRDSFLTFIASAGALSQIAEVLTDEILAATDKSWVAIGLVQGSDGSLIAILILR